MDEPTRRAWSTPELIVLVRSGPEEAVLTSCKTSNVDVYSFAGADGMCRWLATNPGGNFCGWCHALEAS